MLTPKQVWIRGWTAGASLALMGREHAAWAIRSNLVPSFADRDGCHAMRRAYVAGFTASAEVAYGVAR